MDLFSLVAKLTLDADDFNRELDKAESAAESFQMPETEPLTLDNSDFNESLSESESLTGGFEDSMSTSFGNVAAALKTAGIVGSLAAIVGSLKQVIDMTAETADGIDKGAKRMGMSRTAYQEWDHALKQSGAGISDLKKGLLNFQKVQDATDPKNWKLPEEEMMRFGKTTSEVSDDVMEALNELNMMDDVTSGKFGSAEDMMEEALYRIADMSGDPNAQGILVRKLFGKGGDALLPMLADGREAVEDLVDEAGDLGLIMSDEEIDNAVAYGDAVENLNAELDAIKQTFVADIIPVLKDAVENITKILAAFNPRNKNTMLDDAFKAIDQKAIASAKKIDETSASAKKLVEDLKDLGDYWSLDEEGRMTWDALADKALELFPQLSNYIDTDGKKIQGNTQDIEDNIDAWARLEKQRLLSAAMEEKEEAVAKQLTAAYEKSADAKAKEAEAYGAFTSVVDQANKYIQENPNSPLVTGLKLKYGDDFTQISADSADAIDQLKMLGGVEGIDFSNYTKATEEAKALREESEKMVEEAEKAQAGLQEQQTYLEEAMGLTKKNADESKKSIQELAAEIGKIPRSVPISFPIDGQRRMTHAIGSAYIPYDNYPALLHRGEKILTATEARQEGQSMDFSGLEDRIEAAIRKGMDGAQVRSYLNGRDITDEVNRNNINAVKGRRFSG